MINHAVAVGAEYGFTLFRNSVGFVVRDGRKMRYGLCPGSSDLIGWYRTPDGKALFAAVEVKFTKRTTNQQRRFVEAVKAAGGVAGIWHRGTDVRAFFDQLTKLDDDAA